MSDKFSNQIVEAIKAIIAVERDFRLIEYIGEHTNALSNLSVSHFFDEMQRSLIFRFHVNLYNLIDDSRPNHPQYSLKAIFREAKGLPIKNREALIAKIKKNAQKDCDCKLKDKYQKVIFNSYQLFKDITKAIGRLRHDNFAHASLVKTSKQLKTEEYEKFIKWYKDTIEEVALIYGMRFTNSMGNFMKEHIDKPVRYLQETIDIISGSLDRKSSD